MSPADRRRIHGPLVPMEPVSPWSRLRTWLANDALWEPTYRSLVAAVLAVWMTVLLIGLAAWAQVAFPAASQPQADGTHNAGIEAAGGKGSL